MQHDTSIAEPEHFGEHVRHLREQKADGDPSFTLRRVAARCGVTPAYLSRVERGEVPPPSEQVIKKLCDDLGEDPDIALAMAGKISSDLQKLIVARPRVMADLLREIRSMPDHAVIRVVREIRDGNW